VNVDEKTVDGSQQSMIGKTGIGGRGSGISYGLRPAASGLPGRFLRDFGFLRQQAGVAKRLIMVK
jgi:hypothetical protein